MVNRYVTSDDLPALPDSSTGRGNPQEHFRLYRLCPCEACEASGHVRTDIPESPRLRCPDCRGEGRTLDLVATAATSADLGIAIVTLGREGEFTSPDCPIGVLEDGGSWLVKPWQPSPRNVSDAGRVLAQSKGEK